MENSSYPDVVQGAKRPAGNLIRIKYRYLYQRLDEGKISRAVCLISKQASSNLAENRFSRDAMRELVDAEHGGIGSVAATRDWSRRTQRRACLRLHHHHLDIQMGPLTPTASPPTISRTLRAHSRLSWDERLARNTRKTQAGQLTLKLFGIPEAVALWLGLASA